MGGDRTSIALAETFHINVVLRIIASAHPPFFGEEMFVPGWVMRERVFRCYFFRGERGGSGGGGTFFARDLSCVFAVFAWVVFLVCLLSIN